MFNMGRNPKDDQAGSETAIGYKQQSDAPLNSSSTDAGNYQSPGKASSATRAISESESLARDIKEGILSGFVGNGTVLTGEAVFKGMLRIDGRLSGRISSEEGTLIVGSNGQVDADVEVAVATIHGTVNGDIIATKRIEMGRAARVIGNIHTPALVIEQGAIFEGSCRMSAQIGPRQAAQKKMKELSLNLNTQRK